MEEKMKNKEITKAAFEQVEKEAQEKKIAEIKAIVTETLRKLQETKKKIKELQEIEKILKLDIEDLKAGKLDLIAERQSKDLKAKETSVVVIIKEKEVIKEVSPWYWPYQITWQIPTLIHNYCSSESGMTISSISNSINIDCATAKSATIGTYDIDGNIINLR